MERKELKRVLNNRINTQKRIYQFDDKQILILPILEQAKAKDVKFYVNPGKYVTIEEINEILFNNDGTVTINCQNESPNSLFYINRQGDCVKFKKLGCSMKDLTIDHVPSINIVFYIRYLKSDKDFNQIADFTKSLGNNLTTKSIKAGGFISQIKENNQFTNIKQIYKAVFSDISCEITLADNNTANLSYGSLKYIKDNL